MNQIRQFFTYSLLRVTFKSFSLYFREKFGLFSVNLDDPLRTRTPKSSAKFYKKIVKSNGFQELQNEDISK